MIKVLKFVGRHLARFLLWAIPILLLQTVLGLGHVSLILLVLFSIGDRAIDFIVDQIVPFTPKTKVANDIDPNS
jgi:hypothetical protein